MSARERADLSVRGESRACQQERKVDLSAVEEGRPVRREDSWACQLERRAALSARDRADLSLRGEGRLVSKR